VPGVTVISPRRRFPKRLGGLRLVAMSLRSIVQDCDTLWVNDPTTGCFLSGRSGVSYDVTDDWRSAQLSGGEMHRLIRAEGVLAERAHTVVCSDDLRRRWRQRYGVDAVVVKNAVDVSAIKHARRRDLGADGPHIGYVGTLHDERIDVKLVLETADTMKSGRLHLVGPDSLSDAARSALVSHHRISLHGSVPAPEVPSWLASFDVLICPHVVSSFTLSLDAIKAYEYLATRRPIVATPTSGFQDLQAPGLVVAHNDFAAAVITSSLEKGDFHREVPDWADRAQEFALALAGAGSDG
jgi:teichuronic acid biosynthesis glycosyltransferase TuaH